VPAQQPGRHPAATADGVDTPAATHVACLSSDGRMLTYALSELKLMSGAAACS
jgi:topoisomerase-4 subunit A